MLNVSMVEEKDDDVVLSTVHPSSHPPYPFDHSLTDTLNCSCDYRHGLTIGVYCTRGVVLSLSLVL